MTPTLCPVESKEGEIDMERECNLWHHVPHQIYLKSLFEINKLPVFSTAMAFLKGLPWSPALVCQKLPTNQGFCKSSIAR
jgi:hypothetical protein